MEGPGGVRLDEPPATGSSANFTVRGTSVGSVTRAATVLSPEPWWRSPGCTTCCTRPGTTVLATDAHMSVGAGVTAVRRNLEYVPE